MNWKNSLSEVHNICVCCVLRKGAHSAFQGRPLIRIATRASICVLSTNSREIMRSCLQTYEGVPIAGEPCPERHAARARAKFVATGGGARDQWANQGDEYEGNAHWSICVGGNVSECQRGLARSQQCCRFGVLPERVGRHMSCGPQVSRYRPSPPPHGLVRHPHFREASSNLMTSGRDFSTFLFLSFCNNP